MDTNRGIAVATGVLFIVATVADLISRVVLVQPILSAPDYLTKISANENQVLLGALFLFIGAVAASGIALALYPVLRNHNGGLAIGSVGFRLIEGALYLGMVVCLLSLVTLSRESANAGAAASSAYEVPGALLMAARDSLSEVSVLAFGLGALMYYWVFFNRDSSLDGCQFGVLWPSRRSWCPCSLSCSVLSSPSRRPSSSWLFPSSCRRWSWPFG